MSDNTLFHNPRCGTSRNVLALIRHAGLETPFTKSDGEVVKDSGKDSGKRRSPI